MKVYVIIEYIQDRIGQKMFEGIWVYRSKEEAEAEMRHYKGSFPECDYELLEKELLDDLPLDTGN